MKRIIIHGLKHKLPHAIYQDSHVVIKKSMRGIVFCIIAMIVTIYSCTPDKKQDDNQRTKSLFDDQDPYTPANGTTNYEQKMTDKSSTENTASSSNSTYLLNPQPVMDDEEDAYEEGRALSEEDRLARTRSHEGNGVDDEDYDDDYDDGYDE